MVGGGGKEVPSGPALSLPGGGGGIGGGGGKDAAAGPAFSEVGGGGRGVAAGAGLGFFRADLVGEAE